MALVLGCGFPARAVAHYEPMNPRVKLTSTNLPIVWLEVDGTVDRYERITARMKIIDNGNGHLNYADTVAHPGQHVDYDGYIGLRYRGNSSYTYSLGPFCSQGRAQPPSLSYPDTRHSSTPCPYPDRGHE